MNVYAAFIRGQGGALTSPGMDQMAAQAHAAGIAADVFDYEDVRGIEDAIAAKHDDGTAIAVVGYSLGVSTATYLQTSYPFDLVLCIAASSFGQNYPIDKKRTRRSVLWRGPEPLSNAGGDLNFDVVHDALLPHLLMDTDPGIQAAVLAELKQLQRSPT